MAKAMSKHKPNNVGQIALERRAGQFNSERAVAKKKLFLWVQRPPTSEGFEPTTASSTEPFTTQFWGPFDLVNNRFYFCNAYFISEWEQFRSSKKSRSQAWKSQVLEENARLQLHQTLLESN